MLIGKLPLLTLVLALSASCSRSPSSVGNAASPDLLRVGETAPQFSLASTDRQSLALTEFTGESPVLLYFSMGPG